MITNRDYLHSILPEFAKNEDDLKLLIGSLGFAADLVADMQTTAIYSGFLAASCQPDDILPDIGTERGSMFRYPVETAEQYRARLQNAIEIWDYAATEQCVCSQLAIAGIPGCRIVLHEDRVGPRGEDPPYLSQYWISIPRSSLPPLPRPVWGRIRWGFFAWGTWAIPLEYTDLILGIVKKFGDPTCFFRGVELRNE